MLKYDGTDRLVDYFPWQLRYTEFLNVGSMNDINLPSLWQALRKFAKIDKRFGK